MTPVGDKITARGCLAQADGTLTARLVYGALDMPARLAVALDAIPGVVEHGLFIGLASAIIVADPKGVEILGRL